MPGFGVGRRELMQWLLVVVAVAKGRVIGGERPSLPHRNDNVCSYGSLSLRTE